MLRISFSIKNPWTKDVNLNIHEYNRALSKHKHFEAEHYYCGYYLFLLTLDMSWRGEDHAGPELEFSFLGYSGRYKLYDTRHWNYEQGRWMSEQEIDEQYKKYDSYV